jgi:Amt family ammonium transporter
MSRSIRSDCLPGTVLLHRKLNRLAVALVVIVLSLLVVIATPAHAQDATIPSALESGANTAALPSLWYLLAAGLAMLVPAGFVLLASANLEQEHAWNAALGGLAAAGLALFAYWAIGFALQFGGVGLVYPNAGLRGQVWEWSPLSSEWGIGWGMAGLTGWFLSGDLSALSMSLFLGHAPWVMVAALLPVMTLRGRAPALVTLLLALVMGGIVYPLAGNWVQGGGWLNALGRNMELGHGFVDYGGAGSVHLVAAGFALAALTVWSTRRKEDIGREVELPPAHQPLLAVVGALLILGGGIGWMFANPLQVESVGEFGMMRGAVAFMLAAAGGIVFPLFYTWFVTGRSEPTMSARGFVAGVVAGLACGPFVAPGIAFVVGLVAGATVPFITFLLDGRLRVDDRTGVVIGSGVPAMIGLLLVGVFADGRAGAGWQMTGTGNYLGVNGQGVSGLLVASGYQMDFPAQLQSQVIGVVALGLWGFLAGLVVCVPLGLLFHSLLHRNDRPANDRTMRPVAAPVAAAPAPDPRFSAVDTRQPTTTSSFAVPAPSYLDAPARSVTPPPMPAVGAPQYGGSQSPFSTASAPISTSDALPGYAPSERRAPSSATYVAPVANHDMLASQAALSASPTPAESLAFEATPSSLADVAPLPAPDIDVTAAANAALKSAETPFAAEALPVADTSWITAPVRGEEEPALYATTISKTPREGYWPTQAEQASSPGAEYRNPLPEYGSQVADTAANGKENGEPPRPANGAPRNGNPLTRNGRTRTPSLPDDTSPQSA